MRKQERLRSVCTILKNNGACFEVPTVRSTVDMCFFMKMERKSKISNRILFIALD